jgi:myo-inositol-1(or 4)-monophosphatase
MKPATNIAIRAARRAGGLILRHYQRGDGIRVAEKQANDFVSEVDRLAESAILEDIRKAYPDHSILGEESGRHAGNEFEWIVDPLDGTTNFLHGFPHFSVSIALRQGDELISGVVYDPLRDELFAADRGSGAFLNERRIRVSQHKGLKGALLGTGIPFRDQRHLDAYLGMMKVLVQDTAGIRRPGSAALDFAYLAAGRIDGFWELGLAPWDFAAGALLVREAGGLVTDLAGGNAFLATGNVVAGAPRVHTELLREIRPFLSETLTS